VAAMPWHIGILGSARLDKRARWFVLLELFCVVAFLVLLAVGQPRLAVIALAGPFQFLAWCALAGNGYATLVAFAALVPLASAELLPYAYHAHVLIPGTIGLLALLLLPDRTPGASLLPGRISVPERISMLVLATWAVVSAVHATLRGWGNHSLFLNTLLVAEVMLLTYFAAVVPRSLREIRVLLYVILASMALVAAWVPMSHVVSGTLGGKVVSTPFGETNLNIVGCSLATAGAAALGLAAWAEKRQTRFLLSVVVLLTAVALVVTRSRGAWLGFAVASLCILLRTRSFWLLLFGAGCGLGLIASDFLRSLLASRVAATSAYDPSLFGRFVLWYFAWRVSKANLLLGVGMENFRYVKHFYGYPVPWALARPYNAHSLYLEVLADLGVVGFAFFFLLLGSAVVKSWRAVRFSKARDLGLGLSAGLIACAVHGVVESTMFNPGVFALLGVLIGLALSLSRLTVGTESDVQEGDACRPPEEGSGAHV